MEQIKNSGFSLSDIDYLILTHIHLDHAGGTRRFLEKCTSARAFVPERGLKHMLNPEILNPSARSILGERIFNSWGPCEPVPNERISPVKPHGKIALGNTQLEYVPATGHAPHHNVLRDEKNSTVFSADALGILDPISHSIVPTTPPPSFDYEQALEDIQSIRKWLPRLCCLSHFTEIYPNEDYYARVTNRYEKWGEIISSTVSDGRLAKYDEQILSQTFSRLSDLFSGISKPFR